MVGGSGGSLPPRPHPGLPSFSRSGGGGIHAPAGRSGRGGGGGISGGWIQRSSTPSPSARRFSRGSGGVSGFSLGSGGSGDVGGTRTLIRSGERAAHLDSSARSPYPLSSARLPYLLSTAHLSGDALHLHPSPSPHSGTAPSPSLPLSLSHGTLLPTGGGLPLAVAPFARWAVPQPRCLLPLPLNHDTLPRPAAPSWSVASSPQQHHPSFRHKWWHPLHSSASSTAPSSRCTAAPLASHHGLGATASSASDEQWHRAIKEAAPLLPNVEPTVAATLPPRHGGGGSGGFFPPRRGGSSCPPSPRLPPHLPDVELTMDSDSNER
uniref:Uncharacterized protein n=1 Tax=Oryza punctata TaxID=4537 RepID=A0A0E0LXM2_ORYPU